jgi:hypothetical protein
MSAFITVSNHKFALLSACSIPVSSQQVVEYCS